MMSGIRGKNTKPELITLKILHGAGYRAFSKMVNSVSPGLSAKNFILTEWFTGFRCKSHRIRDGFLPEYI
jgi:hypothetical protein